MSANKKLSERLNRLEYSINRGATEESAKKIITEIFCKYSPEQVTEHFKNQGYDDRSIQGIFFMAMRWGIIEVGVYAS